MKLYKAELRRIVRGSDWLMGILETVRDCDPPDWLVDGGVLYKLVWNGLHGYAVPPLRSSLEGIEANPGIATAVGVRLLAVDGLCVAAPLGPRDLFELILARNPRRVTPESFCEWVDKKGVPERWPKVRVIEGDVHPVTS